MMLQSRDRLKTPIFKNKPINTKVTVQAPSSSLTIQIDCSPVRDRSPPPIAKLGAKKFSYFQQQQQPVVKKEKAIIAKKD